MANVIAEICAWATKRPYWEQAALAQVFPGDPLDDHAYIRLVHHFLQDAGLEATNPDRPSPKLDHSVHVEARMQASERHVTQLSNLQNINALVPGQILSFGPHLTIVYGENGSGKSGYARVLGSAGVCRGNREILPNVEDPSTTGQPRSVEIGLSNQDAPVKYVINGPCALLESFHVFDNASVLHHLTRQNTLSFSPAGLSYLTDLADVTDEVRRRVRTMIDDRSAPHQFGKFFEGESEVSRRIKSLGSSTDLKELSRWASVNAQDTDRLAALDTEIAKLKSQDTSKQIAELRQATADLRRLADQLLRVEQLVSHEAVERIAAAIGEYHSLRANAEASGADQFKSERFTQVGSRAWHTFIQAAKALADAERTPDRPYPNTDDQCLLCRQPLSPEARDLLMRLWAFLESDAQTRLNSASTALNKTRDELASADYTLFAPEAAPYRRLQERSEALAGQVTEFVESCKVRRDETRHMVEGRVTANLSPLLSSPLREIKSLIDSLDRTASELEQRDPSSDIAKLYDEQLLLKHRVTLKQHFVGIEAYVQGLVWSEKAAKNLGDTKHITLKYNELFQQLVAGDYVQRFKETLATFGRPLNVRVEPIARKGEALKQIVLATPAASGVSGIPKVTPDRVLSDGEKQAVALADFLTEATLDEDCVGILLDDPVGFLDRNWRDAVAARLVAEAKKRQVIVMTNNLSFVYGLRQQSETQAVDTVIHWVTREGDKPGYVHLNNGPATEEDYKNADLALKSYSEAKETHGEAQERVLKEGFARLRTSYEAFIIFELFGGVVRRFDEQIRIKPLEGLVWDPEIATAVVTKHELLSVLIEGHLHSDVYVAEKPTPEVLKREIDEFHALKARHKGLKKAAQKSSPA
jgi:hypothetical protein